MASGTRAGAPLSKPLVTDTPDSRRRRMAQLAAPIAVLAVATAIAWWLMQPGAPVALEPAEPTVAPVDVMRLEAVDYPLAVEAHGLVEAATSYTVVAEIDATVTYLAPALAVGEIVEVDAILLRLDPRERAVALIEARANLAEAEAQLQQERAEASQARAEWRSLGRGAPSSLTLREPQLAAAEAARAAANAGVVRAELDLQRTVIRAPARVRVRSVDVDVGSFVGRGSLLATLHSLEAVELPLAISRRAFETLELQSGAETAIPVRSRDARPRESSGSPSGPTRPNMQEAVVGAMQPVATGAMSVPGTRNETPPTPRGRVTVTGDGNERWTGRIVRVAGVDPASQQVTVIARLPLGSDAAPLRVGRFVTATISGGVARSVFVVPNRALNESGGLWRIDTDNRLEHVPVRLRWRQGDRSIVAGALAAGDRVLLTRLPMAVDGTRVEPTLVDGFGAE